MVVVVSLRGDTRQLCVEDSAARAGNGLRRFPRPGNLEMHDPDFGHPRRKCARAFPPDSITSIVRGRAQTPEADGIEMINQRHPVVAGEILTALSGSEAPSIRAVLECEAILREADFEMPTWAELADGARPNQPENPEDEPTDSTHGWQRDATLKLETKFFQEQFWPILSEPEQAQMRSQSGPMSSEPFTSFPTSREARFDSQPFRVLLLRRLRLHLPLNVRRCRCGRLLDPFGHHRSACATAGVLGRRGFALESAAARMCREAGGRVMTNVLVRELDLSPIDNRLDGRRLEVVADGLEAFGGAQLAIDTTLVCALRSDGTARPRAARVGGVALQAARARKERTYPELAGEGGRARLVVLAAEVGGRWSDEAACFVRALAGAKAQSEPLSMRGSAARAWCRRWRLLACSAAKAFALSLLEHRSPVSAGGELPPVHDVIRNGLFEW